MRWLERDVVTFPARHIIGLIAQAWDGCYYWPPGADEDDDFTDIGAAIREG